jgi:hypothetical protein
MKGSFNIGLLEVLAYLAPGLVGIVALYIFIKGSVANFSLLNDWNLIYVLIGSYIMGHLLSVISRPATLIREWIKKLGKFKKREERYYFYKNFKEALEVYLGYKPEREEHYPFSLRVVAENCAETNKTIDRLFSLTLFSRNMSVSLIILSISILEMNIYYTLACIIASIAFFYRYIQFERDLESTVFRSAFIYMIRANK